MQIIFFSVLDFLFLIYEIGYFYFEVVFLKIGLWLLYSNAFKYFVSESYVALNVHTQTNSTHIILLD